MTASVLTTSYCVKTERLHNHKGCELFDLFILVQSGKTASGGCSAGQGSSEPVASRIYLLLLRNNPRDPNMHYEPEFTVFLHVTKLLSLHVEYSAFDFSLLRSPAQQPLSTPTWRHQSLFRTTAGALSSFLYIFISSCSTLSCTLFVP
jgi:hypothetical protein